MWHDMGGIQNIPATAKANEDLGIDFRLPTR